MILFRHAPLERERSQIRLLRVINRSWISQAVTPVDLTLEHFDLESKDIPEYKAISYAWGPSLPIRNIRVNGQTFTIRKNLWTFLDMYSRSKLPIDAAYIWIDQICIDQRSVSERNHQLGLMSQIFKGASEVVSWLGTGGHGQYGLQPQGEASILTLSDEAVKAFFANAYWTRLWVAQEIMLAKNWIVLVGSTKFDGTDIISYVLRSVYPRFAKTALWLRYRDSFDFRNSPPSLGTILNGFAHLECENPRDKVYALLALARDNDSIAIDYNLEPQDIFWSAFEVCQTEEGLDSESIINPSGIAHIAKGMGVGRDGQGVIFKADSLPHDKGESFRFLSFREMRMRLEQGGAIIYAASVEYADAPSVEHVDAPHQHWRSNALFPGMLGWDVI